MSEIFGPNFLEGTTPTVVRQIVSAIYCPPFGKVWLSTFCWSLSTKPGNELKYRIDGGWVKCRSDFKPFFGPKFMFFETFPLCFKNLLKIFSLMWSKIVKPSSDLVRISTGGQKCVSSSKK